MKVSILLKLTLFCGILLMARFIKTDHFTFFFLFWNLFLAALPYWITGLYFKIKSKTGQFFVMALALLFLPNAPYILTDLFHLTKDLIAPLWFDVILILSFSLLGLIFFVLAADRIFRIQEPYFRSKLSFGFFKFLVILSNGYGIYLGRYLRLNSWDIFSSPGDLLTSVYNSVFISSNFKETFAITITFAIFLYLVFEIYESLTKKKAGIQNELL